MIKTRHTFASAILVALLATAGCQKATEPQTPAAAPAESAAKVNGAAISVPQIDDAVARVGANNGAAASRADILDKLIDQQLTVEQAIAKKLDQKPDVALALDAARREILSRAYGQEIAAAQPKPSEADIKKFYDEHPELFAQRRVYSLQQLAMPTTEGLAKEIKGWIGSGKSMLEIAANLKKRDVQFRTNQGVAAAEQLPTEVARQYLALKDGQTTVIEAPQGLLVVHLVASQAQPVDPAAAAPRIEQFIANQRAADAITASVKTLREKAKIEKLGEFAPAPAQPANAADGKAPASAPAAGAAK